jgi:hypothetical protein
VLADDASTYLEQLRERGVVLLHRVFPLDALVAMRRAAQACFEAAESGTRPVLPEAHHYNPISRSILVDALQDFGCSAEELSAPLAVTGLEALLAGALGSAVAGQMEQAWVRKRYAPAHAPEGYHPNRWHQDGGLGVRFPMSPGPAVPMTRLLTCWLPLDACAGDRPALEFVRCRLDQLLHYTELDDATLRQRFAPQDFWAPELGPGDGLVFLNGTLHRTHLHSEMCQDRLSVEYRFFASEASD